VYKKSLPFVRISSGTTWDCDNIFMFRFLTLAKVHNVKKILFHYRERDRSNTYPIDYPVNRAQQFMYRLKHQGKVTARLCGIVGASSFTIPQRIIAGLYAVLIYGYYCFVLPVVGCVQSLKKASRT
jgi:hypothetical protein